MKDHESMSVAIPQIQVQEKQQDYHFLSRRVKVLIMTKITMNSMIIWLPFPARVAKTGRSQNHHQVELDTRYDRYFSRRRIERSPMRANQDQVMDTFKKLLVLTMQSRREKRGNPTFGSTVGCPRLHNPA